MTVKNPYEPPTYGVVSLAIERRMAGKPPASEAQAEEAGEKAEKAPLNKMAAEPENKAAHKRKDK